MISSFTESLGEDGKEFNKLMSFVDSRPKLGITSKMVTKYYVKKYVQATQQAAVEPQLIQNGLTTALCQSEDPSELTLYDINLFIRFLVARVGAGAQNEKAQKIIDLGEKISMVEGEYLLKIVDRKLTVGAKAKTFSRAKRQTQEEEGEEEREEEGEEQPKKGRGKGGKSEGKAVKAEKGGFEGCQI
jgi:hypothetical protein